LTRTDTASQSSPHSGATVVSDGGAALLELAADADAKRVRVTILRRG
jgi:hypothetical protein